MNSKISILKSGSIYFFYRHKVRSYEEVQRFFFVLSDKEGKYTSLVVGKKKFPEDHDKYFLFIEDANKNKQELLDSLQEKYRKFGKGIIADSNLNCLAEGKYIIFNHENHTHFTYQIIKPYQLKVVQKEFNLKKEDDYIISVKNPLINPILSEDRRVDYPKNLQEKFGDKHFLPLNQIDFLNYRWTELLLISKKKNISGEEVKSCLEEINQKDLSEEISKVISSKDLFF